MALPRSKNESLQKSDTLLTVEDIDLDFVFEISNEEKKNDLPAFQIPSSKKISQRDLPRSENESLQSCDTLLTIEDELVITEDIDLDFVFEISNEVEKKNDLPVFKIPSSKKTSHRAHPYKLPIRCKRLPAMTSTGVLDHGSWSSAECDDRSAALDVLGMKKLLKSGGFGKPDLMLCEQPHDINKKYVVKFYPKNSSAFLKELEVVRNISHPYVFNLASFRRVNNIDIQLSSYLRNGSLASHIGDLGMVTIVKYFIKITNAVSFLHSRHVYHRDLRPETILIDDDDNPQIYGFDKSDTFRQGKSLTRAGGISEDIDQCVRLYGTLVDSRALGAVLYCMVFAVSYDRQFDFFGQAKDARLPPGRPILPLLRQIIVNLVTPESSMRWDADHVLRFLAQHQRLLLRFCGALSLEEIDCVSANDVRAMVNKTDEQTRD